MTYIPTLLAVRDVLEETECHFCLMPIKVGHIHKISISAPEWKGREESYHEGCFDAYAANISHFWVRILRGDDDLTEEKTRNIN